MYADLRQQPSSKFHSGLYLIPVFVFRFAQIERSQNAGDTEPDGLCGEVATGADSPPEAHGTALRRARHGPIERPVCVQVVGGVEGFGIGKTVLVVVHGPDDHAS